MIDPYEDLHESTANKENTAVSNELTLGTIKDYLLSKGGKVKYAELFNNFKDQIVDSSSGLIHFCFNFFLL